MLSGFPAFPSIMAELLTSKEHCFYPEEVVVHIATHNGKRDVEWHVYCSLVLIINLPTSKLSHLIC